jgi:hypothetical protein
MQDSGTTLVEDIDATHASRQVVDVRHGNKLLTSLEEA